MSKISTLISFDFQNEFKMYNAFYKQNVPLDDYCLIMLFNQAFEDLEADLPKYARTLSDGPTLDWAGVPYNTNPVVMNEIMLAYPIIGQISYFFAHNWSLFNNGLAALDPKTLYVDTFAYAVHSLTPDSIVLLPDV
jgi:hypothetical protein